MLLPPDASQIQGRQAVQDTFQAWIDDGSKDIVVEVIEVEVSEDLAYEIGLFSAKYPAENGQTATATGNYLVIWKAVSGPNPLKCRLSGPFQTSR